MNFTLDGLHAAHEAIGKIHKAERALAEKAGVDEAPSYADLLDLKDKGLFENAWLGLNEDLNTQRAIGAMFGALKRAQNEDDALVQWKGLHFMLHAFGIVLPEVKHEEELEIPTEIQQLAEQRWQARADKEWAKSDELRDELKALGWIVKDGKDGWSFENEK
jgi:cysteinyl-tRNA synthetase